MPIATQQGEFRLTAKPGQQISKVRDTSKNQRILITVENNKVQGVQGNRKPTLNRIQQTNQLGGNLGKTWRGVERQHKSGS